jgi:hypothetical protein
VAVCEKFGNPARHVLDALGRSDRGTAEFLDDQGHAQTLKKALNFIEK